MADALVVADPPLVDHPLVVADPPGVTAHREGRRPRLRLLGMSALAVLSAVLAIAVTPAVAAAAVALPSGNTPAVAHEAGGQVHSLEAAASRAGQTGEKVAMSLIGLALAVAAVVLAFKRDFKEAAAVFAVGMVCILFATHAGVSLLQSTVHALVGS